MVFSGPAGQKSVKVKSSLGVNVAFVMREGEGQRKGDIFWEVGCKWYIILFSVARRE